jgi:hypothetical protein
MIKRTIQVWEKLPEAVVRKSFSKALQIANV